MIKNKFRSPDKLVVKEIEPYKRALRIGVMGAMASGKSTLAKLLGEKWGATPTQERYLENPFLPKFYDDPKKLGISFSTQISFLGLKAEQMKLDKNEELRVLINSSQTVLPHVEIFDPPIEMDALYAQVQAEVGLMGSDEYVTYTIMYEALKKDAVAPIDIFLLTDASFGKSAYASAKVLLERILDKRKREFEHPEFFENYPDYLPRLVSAARQWQIETMSKCPVVLIDSVNNNFADNTMEREYVCLKIEDEIRKFFKDNPYANGNTDMLIGRDGAQIVAPDFIKR